MKNFCFVARILIGSVFSAEAASASAERSAVENGLCSKESAIGSPKFNIHDRMNYYNVPGLSMAVVNNGKIAWARGYGQITNNPDSSGIDPHTLFQAASISKPITAFGSLLLVQKGKISLDVDVNTYLTSWKVPENEFTKTEKVTLRRLLSHTAGLSLSGVPGYAPGVELPSLVDILNGKKPLVNTDPVTVIAEPGSKYQYSGGGYILVQLLIEDVTGTPFAIWMRDNVLIPLGMVESTFQQPLPEEETPRAFLGSIKDGEEVAGGWHVHPEEAAAGLWTTPSDLAKFILYIQSAEKHKKASPLDFPLVHEMIRRQKVKGGEIDFGLGLALIGKGRDKVFGHKGQNLGFISELYGFAFRPQGIVIMVNNDGAPDLMAEITNSVSDVYEWPQIPGVTQLTPRTHPSNGKT